MTWDASQAFVNGRYDQGMKSILTNGGSCGNAFKYPACSAPAWSASGNYPTGSQVRFEFVLMGRMFSFSWRLMVWFGKGHLRRIYLERASCFFFPLDGLLLKVSDIGPILWLGNAYRV